MFGAFANDENTKNQRDSQVTPGKDRERFKEGKEHVGRTVRRQGEGKPKNVDDSRFQS